MKEPKALSADLTDWSVSDLTEALGTKRSMEVLGTTARVIYTIRHTNAVGYDRFMKLVEAVRADEPACRERLTVLRKLHASRRATK